MALHNYKIFELPSPNGLTRGNTPQGVLHSRHIQISGAVTPRGRIIGPPWVSPTAHSQPLFVLHLPLGPPVAHLTDLLPFVIDNRSPNRNISSAVPDIDGDYSHWGGSSIN